MGRLFFIGKKFRFGLITSVIITTMNRSSAYRNLLPGLALSLVLWAAIPVQEVYAITLKQAVSQVERQYQGKVVSARTINQQGRRIHVIRVVTKNGVVKTVRIPE